MIASARCWRRQRNHRYWLFHWTSWENLYISHCSFHCVCFSVASYQRSTCRSSWIDYSSSFKQVRINLFNLLRLWCWKMSGSLVSVSRRFGNISISMREIKPLDVCDFSKILFTHTEMVQHANEYNKYVALRNEETNFIVRSFVWCSFVLTAINCNKSFSTPFCLIKFASSRPSFHRMFSSAFRSTSILSV